MDNNNNINGLGPKTFWLMTLSNSGPALVILIISIAIQASKQFVGSSLTTPINYASLAGFSVAFFAFLMALIFAWLTHINYKLILDDFAFKISKGILAKEEVAIPYNKIQSVDIRQNLAGRIMGVSQLVILTAGHEDQNEKTSGESEAEFPLIDTEIAIKLQEELLKRANTQQVVMASPQH